MFTVTGRWTSPHRTASKTGRKQVQWRRIWWVVLCTTCYAPASRVGALSGDACLTSDVCLSVAYNGPNSKTERPRKTKIGTEVAHVTRDSDTTFKVKRSKVNLQGRGILWRRHAQLVTKLCRYVNVTKQSLRFPALKWRRIEARVTQSSTQSDVKHSGRAKNLGPKGKRSWFISGARLRPLSVGWGLRCWNRRGTTVRGRRL